jgi:predicted DsbA family dithiol-disulfide isomerase
MRPMRKLLFVLVVGFSQACQSQVTQEDVDRMVQDYLDRYGVEFFEKTIEKYLAIKREEARLIEEPEILETLNEPLEGAWREAMPLLGAKEAPVQVVLVADFEDPFSGRAFQSVKALKDKYGDRLVVGFRYNPLDKFQGSEKWAAAAEAAHRQGKFWEMSELVFANNSKLNEVQILNWAKDLNMNVDQFQKDWKSAEVQELVTEDRSFFRSRDMKSTPALIFNGGVFYGARELERFQRIVDTILKSKSKPKSK